MLAIVCVTVCILSLQHSDAYMYVHTTRKMKTKVLDLIRELCLDVDGKIKRILPIYRYFIKTPEGQLGGTMFRIWSEYSSMMKRYRKSVKHLDEWESYLFLYQLGEIQRSNMHIDNLVEACLRLEISPDEENAHRAGKDRKKFYPDEREGKLFDTLNRDGQKFDLEPRERQQLGLEDTEMARRQRDKEQKDRKNDGSCEKGRKKQKWAAGSKDGAPQTEETRKQQWGEINAVDAARKYKDEGGFSSD